MHFYADFSLIAIIILTSRCLRQIMLPLIKKQWYRIHVQIQKTCSYSLYELETRQMNNHTFFYLFCTVESNYVKILGLNWIIFVNIICIHSYAVQTALERHDSE